jgi:transposase InsO family protein
MRIDPKQIIQTLRTNEGRIRLTARELGISPATVINWRNRARASYYNGRILSIKDLARKSTKPKTVRQTSLSATQQDDLLALRKTRGYGAGKLEVLVRTGKDVSTIHRFLKQRGLTAPTSNYRRPRYQKTTHMYLKNVTSPGKLQMDVKYVTPELSGLPHTLYLYAVIDIWSRWKQGVILPAVDQALAIESLRAIIPELPGQLRQQLDFIQTDNGLEFQSRFHRYVVDELGWKHHHIHKSSPNENAVIERSFRTDEEEFFWRIEKPNNALQLNAMYQEYLHDYNTFRPHLGIDLKTPEEKLLSYTVS